MMKMKKLYIIITAIILSGSVWDARSQEGALIYEVTPKIMFNYLTQYFNSDSTYCSHSSNVGNYYQYDKNSKNKITLKHNNGNSLNNFPVAGVTYNIGRNNSADEIYHNEDSMLYRATGGYGPTFKMDNTEGVKRFLFEYAIPKVRSDDPGEPYYGTILTINCGSDTIYDTIYAHVTKKAIHKIAVYELAQTGTQTVQFKIQKFGYPYNGGNIYFYGLRVYDASKGGYLLNTPSDHEDGGTVTKTPNKIGYDIGETVHLKANTHSGYVFNGWSDGIMTEERDVVITANDLTLTALFTPVGYDFVPSTDPSDGSWGTLTVDPVKEKYNVGDVLTLTATPKSASYSFEKWSDNDPSGAVRTFKMPAENVFLTAIFSSNAEYSLTTNVSPEGAGTVSITPRKPNADPNIFYDRDVVDLIATANPGYEFVKWSDGYDDPEYTVRFAGENINLTAEFRTETGNPPTPTPLHKDVIKVDFNISGRHESEVLEPRYIPWVLENTTLSKSFDDVTITMSREGDVGTGLETSWHKATVQAPYYARLVGDGIRVANGDAGGQIGMNISGLRKGEHTISFYLNTWSNPEGNTFSPVDIYVNGELKQQIQPTNRAQSNFDAAIANFSFTAKDYEDVFILLAASTSSNANIKNVCLAGFELNVPNPKKQANKPSPEDLDEHAFWDEENTKSVTIKWEPAVVGTIVKHHVYVGLDSTSVADATMENTDIYKGGQTATNYLINDIYPGNTYYWRIDEEESDGTITEGNVWYFCPRLLAFRGAEGYGRYARGGRGGKVVYVTNLNNDGPGSFREAITNDIGPRYILFAVSGQIKLDVGSRISLNGKYVTVAGQTAPGKGICISRAPFGISGGSDNVVRFMRVRLGQFNNTSDGMGMSGANYSIMDHNTISWTIDEAFSSRNGKNMTLQRTLIAEPLNVAGHKNYPYGNAHGYAATIGGDTASFHHNLLAHSAGRNWSLGGGLDGDGYYYGHLDIFNNVVYNYVGRTTDGGAHEVNFVNNYYKEGRHSSTSAILTAQHEGVGLGTQRYFARGNVWEKYNSGNYGVFECDENSPDSCGCRSQWSAGEAERYQTYLPEPFFPSYATVHTAKNAFKQVISDVGCNMPTSDEHDIRVITDSRDGTWKYKGSYGGMQGIPDHHMDVGGYEEYPEEVRPSDFDSDLDGLPDWWEIEVTGTNPNSAPGDFSDTNADDDMDGYTNLEEYLDWMATPNVTTQKNRQIAIELSQFTKGYTKNPVYVQEGNIENGTLHFEGNWVRFQPKDDFIGIVNFDFKVTDDDGDSMIRRIGVRVKE